MSKKIYIIINSKGSYDDYYDDPQEAYIDKDKALSVCNDLNNDLHKIKNSKEYKEFEETWQDFDDSDGSMELFEKYHDVSRQNDYFIKEIELKDFYKIREENINDLIN